MARIRNDQTGAWESGSTWRGGNVPTAADNAVLDFYNGPPRRSRLSLEATLL